MGYHQAGFEVVGVDIHQQPNYPFEFHQGDAVEYLDKHGRDFDAIHASPPCQAHSVLKALHPNISYQCFIAATRAAAKATGRPWIIENVPGAPLLNPVTLCGSSFGIGVRRHRLFEAWRSLGTPPCRHKDQPAPVDVSGTGGRRVGERLDGKGGNSRKPVNLEEARRVIEMPWATRKEIAQAVPPAYTRYIGRQLLGHLNGHGRTVPSSVEEWTSPKEKV